MVGLFRSAIAFVVAMLAVVASFAASASPVAPTPAPTPTLTPVVGNVTLRLVNTERQAAGLRPLREAPELFNLASVRVEAQVVLECANCLSHDGLGEAVASYSPPAGRVGENLAHLRLADDDATRVVSVWMASEAHRAQILTDGYTRFALAERVDVRRGVHWYALVFATD